MGLARKTFLYSILLAILMVSMVTGYFAFMLPSLYVDYMMKDNLNSIAAIQEGYIRTGSYDELSVKNPSGTLTLEIPVSGDCLYLTNKFFKLTIAVNDDELKELLSVFTQSDSDYEKWQETAAAFDEQSMSEIKELLTKKLSLKGLLPDDYPLTFQAENKNASQVFEEEFYHTQGKLHFISERLIVYESNASDGNNTYINYIAAGRTDDSLVLSFLPVMAPEMKEIRSVVSGSLPMIAAVVFLSVLICSQIFSGRIVNPVVRLAAYAESARENRDSATPPFQVESNDEIGALGNALNELYASLQEKNRFLAEENERQEVFLRASSHQLKTPITAALLLVDGMMNQVGKYKNTEEYLPDVKAQLLSMKKIVEDILYLNHCADNLQIETVSLRELTDETLSAYQIHTADKELRIAIEGDGLLQTDRTVMKKMIDNLLSNAIQYTPEQEHIQITLTDRCFRIQNYGTTIEEELLPNIYEPFVSSDTIQKGKGLGLYVVSYYCRLLGISIQIENRNGSVRAELIF